MTLLGNVDACLHLSDRLDDRVAEQPGKAGITPIVHMQTVTDHKLVERHFSSSCHCRITSKRGKIETFFSGDIAEQLHHPACILGLGSHRRNELRVDQHHIDATRLKARDPVFQQYRGGGNIAGIALTVLVPSCQITRSGSASSTATSNRFNISGASRPPIPRLMMVSEVGNLRRS
jgi:hypothetical protein